MSFNSLHGVSWCLLHTQARTHPHARTHTLKAKLLCNLFKTTSHGDFGKKEDANKVKFFISAKTQTSDRINGKTCFPNNVTGTLEAGWRRGGRSVRGANYREEEEWGGEGGEGGDGRRGEKVKRWKSAKSLTCYHLLLCPAGQQ